MKIPYSKHSIQRLLLLFGAALLITVLVAPEFNLVPARYEEGEIITQTILINEGVTLVDVRSTETRRKKALEEFPPVFDFDTRIRGKIFDAVKEGFSSMRKEIDDLRQRKALLQGKIRTVSLSRIAAAADMTGERARLKQIQEEKTQISQEIFSLKRRKDPTAESKGALEKLGFDLKATNALLVASAQSINQLDKKEEQFRQESAALEGELENWKGEEDQAAIRMKTSLEKALGMAVEPSVFQILLGAQFNEGVESKLLRLTLSFTDLKITNSRDTLPVKIPVIQIKNLDIDTLERFEKLETIVDMDHVRGEINKKGQEITFSGDAVAQRETIIALAQRLIRPNLTENKGETEHLKDFVITNMSPVYFNLKAGDVVAKSGDAATAQQVEIINALNSHNLKNPKYPQLIGTFFIVILALVMLYKLTGVLKGGSLPMAHLLLLGVLLVGTLLLSQLVLGIIPAMTTLYDFFSPRTYNFLIPGALTAMLAGILLGFEVAMFAGLVQALFLAVMLGNSLGMFIYSLMGSMMAAIPLRNYDTRYAMWQQGLRISLVNVPVLAVVSLLEQGPWRWELIYDLGAGFINGFIVSILATTMLPWLERAFDITTNLRLLELSNMNHPALKELSVRAPGTYHHSIVVGNLSESAAAGILANPLLVRVAAYYHDLGKMLCPLYFVENQHKKNYHDDLPAKTSARIIINHVKDGLEIAQKYRLGKAITDILGQHHGTSLVRFFFHKAQEEKQADEPELTEEEFRYPGPKPQTKEAGLVMVADITEAAIRSLKDPSPEGMLEMVQKQATRLYMEGQLDESGLTFNDLNFIEKTFSKMLISIHHHRISYPDLNVGRPKGSAEGEKPDESDAASDDEETPVDPHIFPG